MTHHEVSLPPRSTRTHPHTSYTTPMSHLKNAMFATPARTTASPYNRNNMSLLPRTGSSSSLHSLTRSPAFMKPRPSPSPSPFPSPMLGSSLSSLTTSALIASHLSSSASSLSLSSLSSLTHSPIQSSTSSGTIIHILSSLNSNDLDELSMDEFDAHAYTEVASHSSSSSSSNNSHNGECEEDMQQMYDYGSMQSSGHMDAIDASVLSVSTSASMMSNMASSSLSYMSFGGNTHYAQPQHEMHQEYPEAAKDVSGAPQTHATMAHHDSHLDLETGDAASASTATMSKIPSYANLKHGIYNTRSRRASSDHLASPYLSPLLLAVMNNETLSSLPSLSFASPALSPSFGALSGNRTTMAMTQHQTGQAQHYHGNSSAVPLSPMSSSATSGMTSMPALSPMASPQASPSMSPLMGSRTLGHMPLSLSSSSLSTLHAQSMWPSTSSTGSNMMMSHYPTSQPMTSLYQQQQHAYHQQQQQLAQHQQQQQQQQQQHVAYNYPQTFYGQAQPPQHGHEQVTVKLEPHCGHAHHEEMPITPRQPSALAVAVASAAARVGPSPPAPITGEKRKSLDVDDNSNTPRTKKTIPTKSVKRRKKNGTVDSPSSDDADDEIQATLTGDYKYQCTFDGCGDCFKTRFSLKRHLKKHTGEKPYVCGRDGCDKTFAEKSTLKRHLRIHTGEKPYTCNVPGCGKLFADRTNVKRHEMIHTGERPYWCPFASCTRGYFWRKHLRKHVSSVHHANLSMLSSYAKKNKQGEIMPGTGVVATAQTVPQSRECGGHANEPDDIVDDPDDAGEDEEDEEDMQMEIEPRPKSKRITTKKSRK